MPGRQANLGEYRYGFNGQEGDNEIKGDGNSLNFKYRMSDPRIGRFFASDPLSSEYPELSVYQFAGNTPIWARELEGLESWYTSTGSTDPDGETGPMKPQVGPLSFERAQEFGYSEYGVSTETFSNNFPEEKILELTDNSIEFSQQRDNPMACAAHFYEVLDILYPEDNYPSKLGLGAKNLANEELKPKGQSSGSRTVKSTFDKNDPIKNFQSNILIDPVVQSIIQTPGLYLFYVGPGAQYHSQFLVVDSRDVSIELTLFDNHGIFQYSSSSDLDSHLEPYAGGGYLKYFNANTIVFDLKIPITSEVRYPIETIIQ